MELLPQLHKVFAYPSWKIALDKPYIHIAIIVTHADNTDNLSGMFFSFVDFHVTTWT